MTKDSEKGIPSPQEYLLDSRIFEFVGLPSDLVQQRIQLLSSVREAVPVRYRLGLIVGRFQPVHYGHIFLIEQGFEVCDKIILGIGSANVVNVDNPFPVSEIESLLKRALREHGLTSRIAGVVRLNDMYNDELWAREVIQKTQSIGQIDVAISHNPWTNRCLRKVGINVIENFPLLDRDRLQGRTIRQILRDEGLLQRALEQT